jgi:hypothetical protein
MDTPDARGVSGVSCVLISTVLPVEGIGTVSPVEGIGGPGGLMPMVWFKLSIESVAWREVTSLSREADALQSSGIRRAHRSVMLERAVVAAVLALARTP